MNLPAVRRPGEGFRSEEARYLKFLEAGRRLPRGLRPYAHQFSWPIRMNDPAAHVMIHHGEVYNPPYRGHQGIDIQVPVGTTVSPAAGGMLVHAESDRTLMNVSVFQPDSGLIFQYLHLASLPGCGTYHIQRSDTPIFMPAGEKLGEVGAYFYGYRHPEGLEDVAGHYGERGDHLHFAVMYVGSRFDIFDRLKWDRLGKESDYLNPLKLLQPLYPLSSPVRS